MYIDPSLAKGLTTRFLTEYPKKIDSKLRQFVRHAAAIRKNERGLEKLKAIMEELFRDEALLIYLGGSRSKPYLGMCLLLASEVRDYKEWQEGVLFGSSLVVTLTPFAVFDTEPLFRISEHAVARLYQRVDNTFERLDRDGQIDTHFILPELKQISIWTTFWLFVLYLVNEQCGITSVTPAVPTSNGLLLAEMQMAELTLENRTFVGDKQLSHDQLLIKECMLRAGAFLQSSPIALGSLACRAIDDLTMDHYYLAVKIEPQAERIARVVFDSTSKGETAARVFLEWVRELTRVIGPLIPQMEAMGVRKFHTFTHLQMLPHRAKITPN